MMRGAQCGGVVTYVNGSGTHGATGARARVVNGKRNNLSELVVAKLRAVNAKTWARPAS
jgi:hypothetical protein